MRLIAIPDLSAAAFSDGRGENGAFLVLRAYFDDSGTNVDPDIACWGGYVATPHAWAILDRAWRAQLADPIGDGSKPRLEKGFHLAHCVAGVGEFRDYKPVDRDLTRHNFRRHLAPVTLNNGFSVALHEVGHAIFRPEWDDLVVGDVREVLGDASTACIRSCVRTAMDFVRSWGLTRLAVVVDRGAYSAGMDAAVAEDLDNEAGDLSVTITGAKVAEFMGLQAADTLATELRWSAVAMRQSDGVSMPEPGPHLNHLISTTTGMVPSGVFVARREEIAATARRVRAAIDSGLVVPPSRKHF